MEGTLSHESVLELVNAALNVIKQHDKGLLQQVEPFSSHVIGELRSSIRRHLGGGTQCSQTNQFTFFTSPGRRVLVFDRWTGEHHFIATENWTADWTDDATVAFDVEVAAAQLNADQRDILREWCAEIP